MASKCPRCFSLETERVERIHFCEHITVWLCVCSICGSEFLEVEYPSTEEIIEGVSSFGN